MKNLKEIYKEELNWFLNNRPKNSTYKEIQKIAIYYANKRYQDELKGIELWKLKMMSKHIFML